MRSQIHHLVTRATPDHGSRPALSDKGATLTYADLADQVTRFGGGLAGLGLRRADRVAVYLDKRIETVTAMLGTSAAGGVFVPINPLLRPAQVQHIVQDSGARVLVTSAERLAGLAGVLGDLLSLHHVVLVGDAPGPGAGTKVDPAPRYQVTEWTRVMVDAVAVDELGRVDTDVAAILYTSGSTGSPKGVVLSHRNLVVGAESVAGYLANTADDVILAALPLSFDAGLSQVTTALSVGAHVVLLNYLLARDVVRACARYKVTGLTCVPPLWIQIAEVDWPADVAERLRYFANTGGRMPKATLDRLRELFPRAAPFLMYGLTEAFRSTYLDPEQVDRRPDSIGKAIPNAEILVLRPDGSVCDPGEHGELVHRGPLVAQGYWRDRDRTDARFRPVPASSEGLVRDELAVWSGDLVYRDDEGFLYFVGRNDEMIKTSGYRVSPSEVEEVAYATGLVRDAVALGVEDPSIGQHIVLVASPAVGSRLDVDQLLAEFRRTVPRYMIPQRVEVCEQIPRSANGKFDRTLVREQVIGS